MVGYWEEPEATASRSSTVGCTPATSADSMSTGNLAVVDRKKDVIVTGGENVSSLEVEQVLHGVPGVGEVAVVGVPDPRVGRERVRGRRAAGGRRRWIPTQLVRAVRAQLAGFKVPRHVVTVDELPKNATGKIVKQEIRAWLAAHPERLGARRDRVRTTVEG